LYKKRILDYIYNTKKTKNASLAYFENWLVGFTTAEGCFCVRENGNHSFSISQSYDLAIMDAIKLMFDTPNKIRGLTARSGKPCFILVTYNSRCLKTITEFFSRPDLVPLGGEKLLQFNEFMKALDKRK